MACCQDLHSPGEVLALAHLEPRCADDALATRVTLDIESQSTDTITTVLHIGHQSPNLTQVRHTFRRRGSAWTLLRREEGPEIKI